MLSKKVKVGIISTIVFSSLYPVVSASEELPEYTIEDQVVSATGYDQNMKNAPASITVISKEEISKNGFTDLRDVLKTVEGVDVMGSSARMGTANISIRGMGSKYTLIMIDGIPLNSSTDQNLGPNGFSSELTSFLPPTNNIERIEVIKGPMSTLYGSDALGGVINIITKKETNKFHGTVSIDHTFESQDGRGDTTRTSFNVSGPIVKNKLAFQFSGSYLRRLNSTDEDGNTADGANVTPSGAKNYYLGGKMIWTPNADNRYTFDISNGVIDYSDHGYSNLGVKFSRQRYVFTSTNKIKNGTFYTDLTYQNTKLHDWGHFNGTSDLYKTMKNDNIILNSRYVTELGNHKLTVGTKLHRESVDLDTLRQQGVEGSIKGFNKALFAEDTWKINKLSFTYGLRLDMPDYFENHLSPRAYLVYEANKDWTFKGGITSGYKAPSLVSTQNGIIGVSDSRQGRGGGKRTYIHGNPNLTPEISINKEIGVYYGRPGKFNAHLTYFDIDYKDKISTVEIDSKNQIYTNTDKAHSHGLEFGTKIPLHRKWNLDMNATFTMTEIRGGSYEGQAIDHTPKYMFKSRLTYFPDDKTTVWLSMEWRDKMARYAGGTKENAKVIDTLGRYYKPYTIFNMGVQHKINDNLQVSFAINNLFNKNFDKSTVIDGTEYNYYCSVGKGGTGTYIGRRSYWVGLTYNF
jgi:outer membrane receptor for ferrienterochelin and colicins